MVSKKMRTIPTIEAPQCSCGLSDVVECLPMHGDHPFCQPSSIGGGFRANSLLLVGCRCSDLDVVLQHKSCSLSFLQPLLTSVMKVQMRWKDVLPPRVSLGALGAVLLPQPGSVRYFLLHTFMPVNCEKRCRCSTLSIKSQRQRVPHSLRAAVSGPVFGAASGVLRMSQIRKPWIWSGQRRKRQRM